MVRYLFPKWLYLILVELQFDRRLGKIMIVPRLLLGTTSTGTELNACLHCLLSA